MTSSNRFSNRRCVIYYRVILVLALIALYTQLSWRITRLEAELDDREDSPTIQPVEYPLSSRDELVVLYNRVPKTASTTLMGLAYDLCAVNKFRVLHLNTTKNMHTMSLLDQMRFARNITEWKAMMPALYHGHLAFFDFSRVGVNRMPIMINLLRKPLDRLVSYYYFLRNGDDFRPSLVRRRSGNKVTFDECIRKNGSDCNNEKMWLQVPFFCGHAPQCWIPGNAWALEQAKRNLAQHYLVVGLTEQFEDFVAVLEALLPRMFTGATKLLASGTKSHLRKTTSKRDLEAVTIARVERNPVWRMEQNFYDFAYDHFNRIRDLMFLPSTAGGERNIRSQQQFFFEKIRPKPKK